MSNTFYACITLLAHNDSAKTAHLEGIIFIMFNILIEYLIWCRDMNNFTEICMNNGTNDY